MLRGSRRPLLGNDFYPMPLPKVTMLYPVELLQLSVQDVLPLNLQFFLLLYFKEYLLFVKICPKYETFPILIFHVFITGNYSSANVRKTRRSY